MSTKSFLHEVMSLAWQFVRKKQGISLMIREI